MTRPITYEGKEPYIFVSYAHRDSAQVLPIISALQDRGFRVWYDAGIEAGFEWPEYIAEHLLGCTVFLAFLSQTALDSPNCRQEINFAIEKRKEHLVVYLEEVELSPGMQMRLGIVQNVYRSRYDSLDLFVDALAGSRILLPCAGEWEIPTPVQQLPIEPALPEEPLADPETCFARGECCYDNEDYAAAFRWYELAARQGHIAAQNMLGNCYGCGLGTDENEAEAMKWYRHAAEQGNMEAQYNLGMYYYLGRGIDKNVRVASFWLRRAAQQGDADAQERLLEMGDLL